MKSGIQITRVWVDDDLIELEISTSDGISTFNTNVYSDAEEIGKVVAILSMFKSKLSGGECDVMLGSFGPDWASGAFTAHMHFHASGHGRLYIAVKSESEWREFASAKVASEAKLYLESEPVLLDRFIEELKALQSGTNDIATLQSL